MSIVPPLAKPTRRQSKCSIRAAAVLSALLGCSGSDPGQLMDRDASTSPGASNSASAGSSGARNDPEAPEPECSIEEEAPPSPLRRLTRREYDNTVRDLLGLSTVPSHEFPTDPLAGGFDNNAAALSISPLHAETYLEAAEALAKAAVESRFSELVPCSADGLLDEASEAACAQQFVETFGRRAYRRPLTSVDVEQLVRAFAAGREAASFESGVELVIQTVLQSPAFLYRFELGADPGPRSGLLRVTQYELASRLSYFLWGSMPSSELLDAAEAGELEQPERIADWTRAMLEDERARSQLAEFHQQWLGLSGISRLSKDPDAYPELDDELRAAMGAELAAVVEHVMWSADHRLATLLSEPIGFVTAPLADLYGVDAAPAGEPQLVQLDPAERAGVLTQAAVLALHSLPDQSSPVSRGKLVREKLLCQQAPAPPPNLNITPPEVDPTKSTRERFAEHTASAACAACHELMDPIGFAFESYDALGRHRHSEGGASIDTSGWISGSEDADGPFENVRELVQRLSSSKQVQDCVATQWFRFAFGRYEAAADACSLAQAQQAFTASDGDVMELLVAFTQTESFLHRRAIPSEEALP